MWVDHFQGVRPHWMTVLTAPSKVAEVTLLLVSRWLLIQSAAEAVWLVL